MIESRPASEPASQHAGQPASQPAGTHQRATFRSDAAPLLLTPDEIGRALRRISHEILEQLPDLSQVVLLGIPTRGVPLARRIASVIKEFEGIDVPVGSVDVGLYRDDLDYRPTTRLGPTEVPVNLDGRTVVLVDDVLFTGRTIRAALDALADLGRPRNVQLAALVDRGHRQLPIRADYVGKNLPTSVEERVTVQLEETDGTEGVWLERAR